MRNERFDICIQTVWRERVLEKTLESFIKHLFAPGVYRFQYHVICNIDPIGDPESTTKGVKDLVTKYFNEKFCEFITPEEPNFTQAVISTWERVKSPFFFNLEDDWIMNKNIPLEDMYIIMEHNPRIASLTFPKAEWKRWYFSQNPSMVRAEWARRIIRKLNLKQSVEHQLDQNTLNGKQLNDLHIRYPHFRGHPIVTETGRVWRKKHGFVKPAPNFATWEKRGKK